jgi:hypothetical protein
MLENKDRIAQPSHGRVFPIIVAEMVRILCDLQFAAPPYQKRLDIIFRNSDKAGPHGRIVAALYPADEMIIYSVPEDIERKRAKIVLDIALRELADFGIDAKPVDRRRMSLSYRVYYTPQGGLIITKRVRKGTQAKYRGDAKFSNAFKLKDIRTDEQVIKSISLI